MIDLFFNKLFLCCCLLLLSFDAFAGWGFNSNNSVSLTAAQQAAIAAAAQQAAVDKAAADKAAADKAAADKAVADKAAADKAAADKAAADKAAADKAKADAAAAALERAKAILNKRSVGALKSYTRPTVTTIEVYDLGVVLPDGSTSVGQNSVAFATHSSCPEGANPYFVFAPSKTQYGSGAISQGRAFKIMFDSYTVNASAGNYQVYVKKNFGTSSSLGFTWIMFCYPSTMTVPGYLPVSGNF